MKVAACIATAIALHQSLGCNPTTPEFTRPPVHRFENISVPGESGIALDTVTGQWCKTWEWEYKQEVKEKSLGTIPTCESLFLLTEAQVNANRGIK